MSSIGNNEAVGHLYKSYGGGSSTQELDQLRLLSPESKLRILESLNQIFSNLGNEPLSSESRERLENLRGRFKGPLKARCGIRSIGS
jgi:hypothetical protein